MEKILIKIDTIIEEYESGQWNTKDRLRVMLRELETNIYYLTKYNIDYFNEHNAVKYKHKGSVAAGEILANEQWPELRQTRRIIMAANNVSKSMVMELSILNKES